MRRLIVVTALTLLVAAAAFGDNNPSRALPDPVLVAAGDISASATEGAQTANLIRDTNKVPADASVASLGDHAYEDGTLNDFNTKYEPTWGHNEIQPDTKPTLGNHDAHAVSQSPGAQGYFTYFGEVATGAISATATGQAAGCTVRCKGWYSYNVGGWHVVVLNSECNRGGSSYDYDPECDAQAMKNWLVADLEAHASKVCTLAYWHRSVISMGPNHTSDEGHFADNQFVGGLWQTLYDKGVDLVLNGHEHNYQRFAPLNRNANDDDPKGVRYFIVGTGGRPITPASHGTGSTEQNLVNAGMLRVWMDGSSGAGYGGPESVPNRTTAGQDSDGVLKLTLHATSYEWEFLPTVVPGFTFTDTGSDSCRKDSDGDGVTDQAETNCGSAPIDSAKRPERVDGIFIGVSDDGDTEIDEALPAGSEGYDCDGDGYIGSREQHVFQGSGSAQHDQDPCGGSGWPSDLLPGGFQPNKVNIEDLANFVAPVRRLGKSEGDADFGFRWDLTPGKSGLGPTINIVDIAAITSGATGYPSMHGGVKAFGGPECPWPPGPAGGVPGAPASGGSSDPLPINLVAIDLDANGVPGNTANSVGTIETCRYLATSETFDIDIVVVSVPDAIEQSGGIVGFQFKLTLGFPAATWIMASQPNMILGANAGSSLFDAGDTVQPPDMDGSLVVAALDTSESTPESGAGVLARITLYGVGGDNGLFGSGPWERSVTLSEVAIIDAAGSTYMIDNVRPAKLKGGFANPCLPGE